MKPILTILLILAPLLEIWIDKIDWKKKRTNRHGWTALLRWVIMGLVCFACYKFLDLPLWRTAPLALFSHLLLFGPLYNVIVMKTDWYYLSPKVWWDRIEIWIGSKITAMGVIAIKLILLLLSVGVYVYGSPYYD